MSAGRVNDWGVRVDSSGRVVHAGVVFPKADAEGAVANVDGGFVAGGAGASLARAAGVRLVDGVWMREYGGRGWFPVAVPAGYMVTGEVAEVLGVARKSVYRALRHEGLVPVMVFPRYGRSLLCAWAKGDVMRLAEGRVAVFDGVREDYYCLVEVVRVLRCVKNKGRYINETGDEGVLVRLPVKGRFVMCRLFLRDRVDTYARERRPQR